MTDRHEVIREIVVLITQAAARERAMADHLEEGIRMLRSPWLLDEAYLETWIIQARVLCAASRFAHQPVAILQSPKKEQIQCP